MKYNYSGIDIFLPKYLSEDNFKILKKELEAFPSNIDKRMYTSALSESNNIFQGDGFIDFPIIDYMHLNDKPKLVPAIVLSNTCDISSENSRYYDNNIVYAPIIELDKYKRNLINKGIKSETIDNHISDIRAQHVSSILFLPSINNLKDSIVFLDRVNNVSPDYLQHIKEKRLFSLSDYGFYLFIFKLSVHFTRIQERVNRGCLS